MESELLGFMQAIAAVPNDVGLRLIFADWLDERGYDERAAQVRQEAADLQKPAPPPSYQPPVYTPPAETLAVKVRRFLDGGGACEELTLQDRAILLVHFTSPGSATRQHIGRMMAKQHRLSLDVSDLSPAVKKALGR